VIPPGHSGEFVARMEDVLEVYHRPYDERRPLVCLDEVPVQLVGETRVPPPARPGQRQGGIAGRLLQLGSGARQAVAGQIRSC